MVGAERPSLPGGWPLLAWLKPRDRTIPRWVARVAVCATTTGVEDLPPRLEEWTAVTDEARCRIALAPSHPSRSPKFPDASHSRARQRPANVGPMVRCLQRATVVSQLYVEPWVGLSFFTTPGSGNPLGRFDFVPFYAYCQRSLDCIHGNNERAVSIARDEYAFEAIQYAARDSHTLTYLQEGMRGPGQLDRKS